ncbi:glutamine--fructose-6-phosphate transaminase (isomerizing) [uncultured Ruminococcus sp.]|uniref:glutamine--fructose-6-phosphate transaminase (isomerizing) n=1 Tax=uncultured Ruminococcus sp. TaxID=165186 RepID=UPI0026195322|nr:glutamine--fructose-6-phosphate transaminase (isomerizing) [uncultured Ruminococcus sp.]
MCGIVGYVGKRDCTDVLMNGLSKLEYRGYDSAGIAVFQNNTITVAKSKGRLKDLEKRMEQEGRPSGQVGIGHTRWATHGEPSDVNSHPHSGGRVTIVHNGIIENYKELKDYLMSKGVTFDSDTDTEVVARLLDYRYNGSPIQTISETVRDLEGSYALGIIFADHPEQVYAVRCESPLIVGVGEDESFIASDVPAILEYTRDYYLLEHEEIAVLGRDGVHIYDAFGQPVEKELKTADWDVEAIGKGGYAHFMLKEIHEQPTAIRNTILPRIQDGLPNLEECGITLEVLREFHHIHVVACGTAMHAGTVGKYVIEKLARVPVTVDIASEFRYRDPLVGEGDLVIIISQSGETADSLAAMRLAKSLGAKTLAIVNAMGSSIAREADMLIYTHAGPEIAVASTKAYMVQIAVMYLFAFELALAVGKIDETECRRLVELLQETPDSITGILEHKEQAQYIASSLITADSLLYIGRGLDYALSMEGSLKLKEISYIHSESYAAGELKHGTISLITENMPVIAVATQKALKEKTISNIKEVKARGAKVILVCRESDDVDPDAVDLKFGLPEFDDLLMPMIAVVPLQLIAYYTSVLKGNDVDKPRNLAKSVTVE